MTTTLHTVKEASTTPHREDTTFVCADCGITKPVQTSGGTGYARRDGKLICYECCAKSDRDAMIKDGKITLYLTHTAGVYEVTNWPGTLRFSVDRVHRYRHPFAEAVVAYFTGPDGKPWSARNIGDSEIAHCRRLKG